MSTGDHQDPLAVSEDVRRVELARVVDRPPRLGRLTQPTARHGGSPEGRSLDAGHAEECSVVEFDRVELAASAVDRTGVGTPVDAVVRGPDLDRRGFGDRRVDLVGAGVHERPEIPVDDPEPPRHGRRFPHDLWVDEPFAVVAQQMGPAGLEGERVGPELQHIEVESTAPLDEATLPQVGAGREGRLSSPRPGELGCADDLDPGPGRGEVGRCGPPGQPHTAVVADDVEVVVAAEGNDSGLRGDGTGDQACRLVHLQHHRLDATGRVVGVEPSRARG